MNLAQKTMSLLDQSDRAPCSVRLRRRDFFKVGMLATTGLAGGTPTPQLSLSLGGGPFVAAEELPTLGDAAQLFVDLDRVESLDNVKQVFHSAEKHAANPVLRKVKPWENDRGTWGSVIYDEEEKLFKAWYGGVSGAQKEFRPGSLSDCSVLCYATSRDGIHWDRPELGLCEVMGTRKNNVVIGDDHHNGLDHWESTVKDPLEKDPERRYKALGWSSHDWDGPMSGIYSMTSPDGLRWTHTPEPVFHYHPRTGTKDLGPVGDAQSLMIDTLRRRYVAFLRNLPHRSLSTSDDFVTWTPPRVSIEARPGEEVNTVYNHMGFVYGDRYLGLLTYFVRDPSNPLLTVRLLTSRDGDTWQRPDAAADGSRHTPCGVEGTRSVPTTIGPLIDVGGVGEWDRFIVMLTGAPPIRVGDRVYIYYRGLANRHKPYEGKDEAYRRGGGIGLATLRLDGFASLQASYDGGRVTTKPFRFLGSELHVNAKADSGQLFAAVLDAEGQPIPGFTRGECEPMRADSVDHRMTWKENGSFESLRGQPIRLQFHLENARLYSFRIVSADR